jgi:hypothetical protein
LKNLNACRPWKWRWQSRGKPTNGGHYTSAADGPKLQRQTDQTGDRIFKEGDEGNMAYIVQSGEVEIVKEVDGVETVLGTVGQGEYSAKWR